MIDITSFDIREQVFQNYASMSITTIKKPDPEISTSMGNDNIIDELVQREFGSII